MSKLRKPLRLQGYDYTRIGSYFITICLRSCQYHFAQFAEFHQQDVLANTTTVNVGSYELPPKLVLTEIGKEVKYSLMKISNERNGSTLGSWIIMADHIHFIVDVNHVSNCNRIDSQYYYSRISPQKNSIGLAIRQFKAGVTGRMRKQGLWDFKWQRSYYDHVIRSIEERKRIEQYIRDNPTKLLEAQIRNSKNLS